MTIKSGGSKRKALFDRQAKTRAANEKNDGDQRDPEAQNQAASAGDQGDEEDDEEAASRTVFFNIPLPDHLKDEEGNPILTYPRNKIRTAKYTPLSFIPKNLWFQFHNIANVFFLFLVILVVRISIVQARPRTPATNSFLS